MKKMMKKASCYLAVLSTVSAFNSMGHAAITKNEINSSNDVMFRLRTISEADQKKPTETFVRPKVIYRTSKDSYVWLTPEFKVARENASQDYNVDNSNIGLRYDLLNILTEEDHGVKTDISTRYYTLPVDERAHGFAHFRNWNQRKFENGFMLRNKNKFYVKNVEKSNAQVGDRDYYQHEILIMPSYMPTDSWIVGFDFANAANKAYRKATSYDIFVTPNVRYLINDQANIYFKTAFLTYRAENARQVRDPQVNAKISLNYNVNANFATRFDIKADVVNKDGSFKKKVMSDTLKSKLMLTAYLF